MALKQFSKSQFKTVSNNEINVILLGESGVGKSTFINALANYFAYDTFDEARNNDIKCIIPASFYLTDDKFEQVEIKIGDDENEVFQVGKAATQFAKTHTIEMKGRKLNIIDTPGIGDPDGFVKDKENFLNTIKYISKYKEMNGICILLKPNNARLDLQFRFCFKELLVHLHKSAAPNIVFCFTNSRGTFYKPGESYKPLETLVKDVEKESKIKIPLDKNNIFCFDNEAFRCLAAIKNRFKFNEQEIDDFSSSWVKSSDSAYKMMSYITNLPVHEIRSTVKLNEAREILMELSKPIAEISQNIQINIKLAADKKKEIDDIDIDSLGNVSLANLEKQLYIEQIDFDRVPLSKPRTVCTDPSCTRTIKVGNVDKVDYCTHCHPECYLEGIEVEVVNSFDLKNCNAMQGTDNCTQCKHHVTKHMHIIYENIEKSTQVVDQNVQSMIEQKKSKKEIIKTSLEGINDLIKQLKQEQKEIIQISAKFASFLKQHSIIVFNDDLDKYLDLLIREEEQKKQQGGNNEKILKGLRDVKKAYEEQKKIFNDALKANNTDKFINVDDIDQLINELFDLPLSGDKIKKVVDDLKSRKPSNSRKTKKP